MLITAVLLRNNVIEVKPNSSNSNLAEQIHRRWRTDDSTVQANILVPVVSNTRYSNAQ